MATETDALRELTAGTVGTSAGATAVKEKNSDISKNEFLTLLVTQLQNQDPLEPMDNEQFAVNLAQFSQLEQLVSINEKIEGTSGADLNSLATYLGHVVTLGTDQVAVKNGDGGSIQFNLESESAATELELLDADGQVVKTVNMGAMSAGKQNVRLEDVEIPNGTYTARVKATGLSGIVTQPVVQLAGLVDGFIPGPEPKLLVNGNEVDPSSISSVFAAN